MPNEISLDGVRLEGCSVRRGRTSDAKQIYHVEKNAQPAPWSENIFVNEFSVKWSNVWVVEDLEHTKSVVAFLVFWNVHDEIHILNIAVHENSRRRGIASALIHELKIQSKLHQKTVISLEVRASNSAGQSLYEGLGFQQIARRKAYYSDNQEDAIILACIIEEFY